MKNPPLYRPASTRSIPAQLLGVLADALDRVLNQFFAFNHETATLRSWIKWVGLILIWIVLAFTAEPAPAYAKLVDALIKQLAAGDPQSIGLFIVKSAFSIFLNPVVIRHLMAICVPYIFMHRVAAVYLADIFEKDEKVALAFIRQAAFAGPYNSIRIRQGKVAAEDQASPMIQFGGPGYVIVELDSAVVVEKPDGSARVIGPSNTATKDNILTGFERIRQGLDLRDILQKQEVTARSRDGIPVSARDVQYSYSIFRGYNPLKTPKSPYPYDPNAALNLVYGASRPVKFGEPPARTQDWLEPLPGKTLGQVGGEMDGFIKKHGLSEFLAAVGKLENDNLSERKKEIDERIRALAGPGVARADETAAENAPYKAGLDANPVNNPPAQTGQLPDQSRPTGAHSLGVPNGSADFVSRSTLTNLFYDHIQSNAAQRGTQLNWIGVGTWDTPAPIIPKNHLEAWKISRENFARGNPSELKRVSEDARLQEIIHQTRKVAIRKLYSDQSQGIPDEQVITNVLKEYLAVLDMACDYYRGAEIPGEILDAIREIKRQIYPPSHSMDED